MCLTQQVEVTWLKTDRNGGHIMELRNKAGDIAKVADNLTLKEITEMGYTVDLCDEANDPSEHWKADADNQSKGEYPED